MSRLKNSFSWNGLCQSETNKKELNELNSRFVNFLQLVKLEQKKYENLTNCINELKKNLFSNHAQLRQKYDHELNLTKQELNRLCLELNSFVIKERRSRFSIELYSHLEPSITHENLDYLTENCDKLSSALSSSQSSLFSSCSSQSIAVSSSSCSSSSSSSSYSADSVSTAADSALAPSPSLFSLETYLNSLNQNRCHLNEQYVFKLAECEKLKNQCNQLNDKLFDLNNSLDTVRLDNNTLNDRINSLKREINFYKNLCQNTSDSDNLSVGMHAKCDSQKWYLNELDQLKRDIRQEFERSHELDIESFEACLQDQILNEIDQIQLNYEKECDQVEAESTALLNELSQLNENLCRDFDEYQQLRTQNTQLNNRMIELSTKLLDFNQMDESVQNKMILNYSVKCLNKDVDERREQVKSLQKQFNQVKIDLSRKNMLGFNQTQFNLKPYTAQIENTKSNLFSYLIVKFDFIYNTVSGRNRSILNSLKIVDSMDGHWLTMENDHKILDIDLSEWIIRREIYSSADELQPNKIIEYKLPKFFKLKRRKKVNFVCSTNLDVDGNQNSCSSFTLNSLPKLTQLKCACCACKLMVKRNGDTDILEVRDVQNWGTGSLIVTKLIDKKNVLKMANFKFLKQIWINDKICSQNNFLSNDDSLE